jgi:hypothetical protein
MKIAEVTSLLGPGKQLSESVGDGGLKTQVFEYLTDDRRVEVTYVAGLVVRFSVSSKYEYFNPTSSLSGIIATSIIQNRIQSHVGVCQCGCVVQMILPEETDVREPLFACGSQIEIR